MADDIEDQQGEIEADGLEAENFKAGFERFSTEGVEADASYIDDFKTFIGGLGLRHFAFSEFLFLGGTNSGGGSCSGHNAVPPRSLWQNIAPMATVLDELRQRLGATIQLSSIYRDFCRAVSMFSRKNLRTAGAGPAVSL